MRTRRWITAATIRLVAAIVCAGFGSPLTAADLAATVGDRAITRQSVDLEIAQSSAGERFHRAMPEARRRELGREALGRLINRELMILGGLDAGIPLPLKEAEAQCREMAAKLGPAESARALKERGWTEEDHIRIVAESLLGQQVYTHAVIDKVKVTDEDIRREYEATRETWKRPAGVCLSHILLSVSPGASPEARAQRKAEASAIVSRLRDGEPFGELAAAFSGDAYRTKGGDLGMVHRGRLVPELENAVWDAAPGSIVGPVESSDGLHIMTVGSRIDEQQLPLSEVAPAIRAKLQSAAPSSLEQQWLASLRKAHPVVIVDESLR